jgi:hypothetical protein
VATPAALTVSPLWSLRRSSSTFGETDIAFDRAKGMDVPANTVVATFMFRTMLTTSTATDITTKDFQINDADSIYLACTATALDPGAVHYTVKDTCGDAIIRQQLLGYADTQEPAIVVTQSAILVRSGARSTDGGHVVICDVLGHPIISTDVAASAAGCAVSIAALPSGVYFVRLTTNAGFIRTTRFIVSR